MRKLLARRVCNSAAVEALMTNVGKYPHHYFGAGTGKRRVECPHCGDGVISGACVVKAPRSEPPVGVVPRSAKKKTSPSNGKAPNAQKFPRPTKVAAKYAIKFPHGTRPRALTLCCYAVDGCYTYDCEFAHSQASHPVCERDRMRRDVPILRPRVPPQEEVTRREIEWLGARDATTAVGKTEPVTPPARTVATSHVATPSTPPRGDELASVVGNEYADDEMQQLDILFRSMGLPGIL